MSPNGPHSRVSARVPVQLELLLQRPKGSRIPGRTLDLGVGGMRVMTDRPLTVDEVLEFDLPLEDRHVPGHARVLRMHGHNVYALRFEDLAERDRELLGAVAGRAA